MSDLTLFEDGCPDEQHSWTPPTITETTQGTLIGQSCMVCGLVWVRLRHTDAEGVMHELGLSG